MRGELGADGIGHGVVDPLSIKALDGPERLVGQAEEDGPTGPVGEGAHGFQSRFRETVQTRLDLDLGRFRTRGPELLDELPGTSHSHDANHIVAHRHPKFW